MSSKVDDGLTRSQRWYRKHVNLEEHRERIAAYRREHPEEARKSTRKYYQANREKCLEDAKKRYQERYKEKARTPEGRLRERMRKAKRRAIKAGLAATLTWQEWAELCKEANYRCTYCRQEAPLEQDHVIPITRGGPHTKENVVPACKRCNASKGSRHDKPLQPADTITKSPAHLGTAKLTADDVYAIRALGGTMSHREIGAMFGICSAQAGRIILRKAWAWLP